MSQPISWLGQIIPGLTAELEVTILVVIIPFFLFLSIFLHILMMFLMPRSGMIRLKARLRRDGVLVQLFSDEGFERTELMKSDLGQGILSGNPTSYIFTPRPPMIKEGDKEMVDLSPDTKANLDEALSHRFFTDTGKPLFLGYVGKSVAVTPRLLKVIKDVHSGKKLRLKKRVAEEPKDGEEQKGETIQVRLLTLLNPLTLKLYLGKTFSRSLIESIKAENERKGYLRKPAPIEFLTKNPVSVGLIIVVVVLGFFILSGQLDIMGLFGLGGTSG